MDGNTGDAPSTSKPGRKPRVSNDEILALIERLTGEGDRERSPVVTADDLAVELPISARALRYRLDQLVEDGTIASRTVGSRAKVWWPINDAKKEN